jgi:hypothetical protein
MKFVLHINCVNDLFQLDARPELSRLLREVATRLEDGDSADFYRTIYDTNGNDVGRFKLVTE